MFGPHGEFDFKPSTLPPEYDYILLQDLVVFVDPVDGTREFVENRLESVQTLIGIAWRGRAIAGVIGLPFHDHSNVGVLHVPPSKASGGVLRGIVGVGAAGVLPQVHPGCHIGPSFTRTHPTDVLVCAASKSIQEPALVAARAAIGGETVVAGGCGNKILRLALGQADVCLFNLGTSLWDTWSELSCLTMLFVAPRVV